jgi:hypothetical protein
MQSMGFAWDNMGTDYIDYLKGSSRTAWSL